VAFSKDGTRVLTASTDGTAKVWNSKNGELEQSLSANRGAVLNAEYSSDSKFVVTSNGDGTAIVWEASTGTMVSVLAGHGERVNRALFSNDGLGVFTCSDDRTARIWNIAQGAPTKTLSGPKNYADLVRLSDDGTRAFGLSNFEHTLFLWDIATGSLRHTFDQKAIYPRGNEILAAPAISPSSSQILTVNDAGIAQLWSSESFTLLRTFNTENAKVNQALFSPDGQRIVTGSTDGVARIWQVSTGQQLSEISNNGNPIESLAYSADQHLLMVSGADGPVQIWNVLTERKPTLIAKLAAHGGFGIFSPGREHALLFNGGAPQLWNVANSQKLYEFSHAEDIYSSVNFVDVSPDGRLVLTASDDNTVRIWSTESGSLLHVLAGHSDRVTAAMFSRTGRQILSVSNDGSLRTWDVATGTLLAVFLGHVRVGPNRVATIASVHGSRDTVITSGIDGTVRVWTLPIPIENEGELVLRACSETLRGSPTVDSLSISVLTPTEQKAAPAINAAADFQRSGDVCAPVSVWRRLIDSL